MRHGVTALVMLLLASMAADTTCAGRIIYVDADAKGASNGASWANAYPFLQDGLAAAFAGDEIRVAQGVYQPDRGSGKTPGDRTATFYLLNGVTLRGGYAGWGEANPDARDVQRYQTILSGDLKGNDTGALDDPSRGENSYTVVSAMEILKTAVIEGFAVTGGNANGSTSVGSGMNCWMASPTVTDCVFRRNYASGCGGGLCCLGGTPTFTRCTFEDNWSTDRGCGARLDSTTATLVDCLFQNNRGQRGGGVSCEHAQATLTNCTFVGNAVKDGGGGMHNNSADPKLTACTFRNNSAGASGGGLENEQGNPTLVQCRFEDNQAAFQGGGVSNAGGQSTFTNCLFLRNSATTGGGMLNGYGNSGGSTIVVNCAFVANVVTATGAGVEAASGSNVITNCTFLDNITPTARGGSLCVRNSVTTVTNCILWSDALVEVVAETAPTIAYSCVRGGTGQPWFAAGCVDADPLFADPNGRLSPTSPCVDKGNNAAVPPEVTTDLDGHRRIQGAVVDLGAYEVIVPPEVLLDRAIALLQGLGPGNFVSSTSRSTLMAKLQADAGLVRTRLYRDALNDLRDVVLPTLDGCAKLGRADDNDWIVTCEAQQKVYPLISEAIEAIGPLIKRMYALTVSATPGGSVTKPGEGVFSYTEGDTVPLEAVAKSGYRFTNWSGTAVNAGKITKPDAPSTSVIVDANYTVVANFAVSTIVEDFEKGQFNAGWSSSSSAPWCITSEDAHSGKYCARAGVVQAPQSSQLTLRATVGQGRISFWRKVSSEEGCTYYSFWIDGKPQETVTGEQGWRMVSFPVSAGNHTFTWDYRRDSGEGAGQDTAYIDDVTIPQAP